MVLPFEPETGATDRVAPDVTALDAALDSVRDRFGAVAVTRAALLGKDRGESVPILPD